MEWNCMMEGMVVSYLIIVSIRVGSEWVVKMIFCGASERTFSEVQYVIV
jgi:hypothetical protein